MMKNNESKIIMNTKYKEKWNYGLAAGIYVLLAGVWGDWFGRPMDNIHTVVSTEYLVKENKLILHFSEGETCTIYEPTGIVNEVEGFHIKDAAKVEWEWYAYGKETNGKALCRRIYTRKDNNAVVIESYGEPEQGVKVLHFHDLYALEIY